MSGAPLARSFYEVDALRLARRLLGKVLVHETLDGTASCRIVEVEAYRGPEDRAAHTAGGRRTPRNEVMWGPAGHLYVYGICFEYHNSDMLIGLKGSAAGVLPILLRDALENLADLAGRDRLGGGED